MSKTIDRSDLSKLSAEELEYLRVRGQLTPSEEVQYLGEVTVTAPAGRSLDDTPNTGDEGNELDEERIARMVEADKSGIIPGVTPAPPGGQVNTFGAITPPSGQANRLSPADYEEASKAELQAEISARQSAGRQLQFKKSDSRADLIEILEMDDEEA